MVVNHGQLVSKQENPMRPLKGGFTEEGYVEPFLTYCCESRTINKQARKSNEDPEIWFCTTKATETSSRNEPKTPQ